MVSFLKQYVFISADIDNIPANTNTFVIGQYHPVISVNQYIGLALMISRFIGLDSMVCCSPTHVLYLYIFTYVKPGNPRWPARYLSVRSSDLQFEMAWNLQSY